jgi:transcriptional regulator of acetoin/glycerol metabolism
MIEVRDLPQNIRIGDDRELGDGGDQISGDFTIKEAEKQLIIRALKDAQGNRSEAARRVGMSRRTLHRKLHEYQLENL